MFAKKRPLGRWQKTIIILGPLLLASVIVVGIIFENQAEPDASADAAPTTSAKTVNSSPPPATPSTDDDSSRDGSENAPFLFGSTAHFTSTAGSNDIPLEFTVSAPTPFTPSKDAVLFDATSYGGGQPGSLQGTNVYFTVTITNTC